MTPGSLISLGAAALLLSAALPPVLAQTTLAPPTLAPNAPAQTAPAHTQAARDWAKAPAVLQLDTTEDVFAIGDVHGDCDRLLTLLAGARIVAPAPAAPTKVRWNAGKSVVVFTGDLIDKGPKPLAVIALLRSLSDEAARSGGRVIVLVGNHEADFLHNPDSGKVKDFATQAVAAGLNPKMIAACVGDVGEFLCAMPFAARVNDWFFSHAGNTGGRTMGQLIFDLESGFNKDGFGTSQLAGENSLIAARLGAQGPGGMSWFEAGGAKQSADQMLTANTAALKVAHIVQGHQHGEVRFPDGKRRKPGEIYQWHGKLFLIDTGMSREIDDSVGAVLHIHTAGPSEATAICPDGRLTRLWNDKRNDKKNDKRKSGSGPGFAPNSAPHSAKGVRCGS